MGLTDPVWGMASRCWQQDPARRPTATEVVGQLREWSVLLPSVESTSRHASCRHRLRTMDPSSGPPPRQPLKNGGTTTNDAPVILAPAEGGPNPTKSRCTTKNSNSRSANKNSVKPILMLNSPRKLSPDEPRPLSNSGNTDGDHTLHIAHSMRSPCQYPSYRPNAERPSRKVGP